MLSIATYVARRMDTRFGLCANSAYNFVTADKTLFFGTVVSHARPRLTEVKEYDNEHIANRKNTDAVKLALLLYHHSYYQRRRMMQLPIALQ